MPTAIKNSFRNRKNNETSRPNTRLYTYVYCNHARFVLCLLMALIFPCAVHAESLQVLHWWKSASERKAVDFLMEKLDYESVTWRDAVVPSGSGVGASIVLRSRILAGNAPEVAQLNGVLISEWDSLGLLLDVDTVATSAKWEQSLLPTVLSLVQPHEHFVAAPLGIHRINTLFYNRKLFKQHGLAVPQTWLEFERLALKLQSLGIAALAQSSEPWQVVSLFETLVLAEGGAGFYRDLFVNRKPEAFADIRLTRALQHLRDLKKWMAKPLQERTWVEVSRQLVDGAAAMMVMGDWAKAELNVWGQFSDDSFACAAVPETANFHLYDIDTFAMLATPKSARPAQEKLANVAMSNAVQAEYNQIKGSVPVLRNPDMTKMDSCARASWKLFASGVTVQVPSLAHRMATDEITKDAMIAEIHQYFLNDKVNTIETQRRLATIARTVTRPIARKK